MNLPQGKRVHWDGAESWVSPGAYRAFPSVLHLPGGIVLFSGRISAFKESLLFDPICG